jgi:ArsR family transcriptional regulator
MAKDYERRAQIIKSLSHPTRLMIIDQLATEETCVNDLQAIVGYDISTVSKHLSVLKEAGIVTDRKAGLQVFYSLRIPCIMEFFGCVEKIVDADAGMPCCKPNREKFVRLR